MARRRQRQASSGAPGLVQATKIGVAFNPIGLQQTNRMKRNYLDPTQALAEWESELSIWFSDPDRVAAFGQPVRPRA